MRIYSLSKLQFIALSVITLLFAACSKDPGGSTEEKPKEENYSSEYRYNLNVVYFVPKDITPNPDYEERISKILIEGQGFFMKWMKYWGFGEKTFGLLKNGNNTRIKIHLVRGPEGHSAYSNYVPIQALVKQYFQDNPGAAVSDHCLILTAVNTKIDQGETLPHEIPYYGVGRWCYALDYPGLKYENLGKPGLVGEKATIHIGGMLHEMGHAINLPHNGPTTSQFASSTFGMTLMGSGNYTFGKSPTFLSFFDAATLNNCQVFSKEARSFYTKVTTKVNTIKATVENNEIVVSGTYTTTNPPTNITFRNILSSDLQGYSSITFTTVPGPNNTFSVKMPVSEFRNRNIDYDMQIFFHHENGNSSIVSFPFKIEGGVAKIDISDRDMLSRTGWTITGVSSQQGGLEVDNVLDGNDNTYWHTSWSSPLPHPHYLILKTGSAPVTAKGVSYQTRPDNAGNAGKIKDFKIEVSDDGVNWREVYTGVGRLNGRQYHSFATSQTFQYLKLTTLSDYEGKTFASIAELDLY